MPPLYHSQTSVTIVEPRTTSDSHARQSIFRPRREEPAVTTSTGCRLELASTSITASTTSMSMSMSKSTSESTSESTNKSTSASKFAQAASATSLSHFMAASSESTQRQRSRTVVSDASDLSRMFGGERASTSEIDSDFDSEFDPDCDADCDADADHGYDHDYDCNSEYGCDCDCDFDSCDSTTGAKALNSPSALLDASHGFVLGSCPNSPLSRLAATFASASASKSTTATATTRPMLPPTTSMKSFRKRTRAVYGVGGAAVGTLLCPVVGTVVGAIGVGCSVNYVLKRRERRVFAKWEKRSVQEQALASVAAVSEHAVYV